MHDTLSLVSARAMLAAVAGRMIASTDVLTAADQAIGEIVVAARSRPGAA